MSFCRLTRMDVGKMSFHKFKAGITKVLGMDARKPVNDRIRIVKHAMINNVPKNDLANAVRSGRNGSWDMKNRRRSCGSGVHAFRVPP